jgi:cbb3-type cytochrome oxidase maturation protein
MSISYLLVLIGLAALGGATWALFWAIDSGQYDDLESQGGAPLEEDPGGESPPAESVPASKR